MRSYGDIPSSSKDRGTILATLQRNWKNTIFKQTVNKNPRESTSIWLLGSSSLVALAEMFNEDLSICWLWSLGLRTFADLQRADTPIRDELVARHLRADGGTCLDEVTNEVQSFSEDRFRTKLPNYSIYFANASKAMNLPWRIGSFITCSVKPSLHGDLLWTQKVKYCMKYHSILS